jgi:hypothetical protein
MDPLLAWRRWRTSLELADVRSAAASFVYPWSVHRFLTARQKRRLEDYTEVDLREFLLREASTAYERRHYERAVRSFFAWCRYLAGLPRERVANPGEPDGDQVAMSPILQPLLRLVVVIAFTIVLEASLAMTIIRSTK